MADNITIKDGGGSNVTMATVDNASVHIPKSTPVTQAGVTMVGTAGSAAAGVMTIQGVASMTPVIVSDGSGALSIDDNSGSLTVDNGGTFAVQVDGSALTALQLIDNVVAVDDAAFTAATGSGVPMMGFVTSDSVDSGDAGAVGMTTDRKLTVQASVASGGIASGAVASGAIASGAIASGAVASGAFASGSISSGAIATGAIAAGAASIAENEDAASSDGDRGVKILFKRLDTPANSSGTDGDYEQPQMSAGRIWTSTAIPSGGVASGAIASGAVASGAFASGSVASGAFASGSIASGAIAAGAIAAGATSIADDEDAASANGDRGVKMLAVRKATAANTSGTDGDYEFLQMSAGALWTATAATDKTLLAERTINGGAEYETVAASQTAQTLGATGATGDYIAGVLVVPATTSPGNVLLLDNATSITIFTGGASSVSNLVSFFIPLGMISVSGAWKLTTGSNVSCIGIGNFT